jgi:dolichol kinase
MALTRGEAKRKLVHVAVGGFAFLLRFLTWPQAALMAVAAFAFNLFLLPRIGGRGLWRAPEHERGFPIGILLYPLAVLALVLVFRHELWMAAAVWAVLAFGDGMATVVGMTAGGPRLPWNPAKGWAGSLAFVLFGTTFASVLAAWTLRLPLSAAASPRVLALTLPLTLLCALVESAPTTLDDNLTVPLTGAAILPLLVQADPRGLAAIPDLWSPSADGPGGEHGHRRTGGREAMDGPARARCPRWSSAPRSPSAWACPASRSWWPSS